MATLTDLHGRSKVLARVIFQQLGPSKGNSLMLLECSKLMAPVVGVRGFPARDYVIPGRDGGEPGGREKFRVVVTRPGPGLGSARPPFLLCFLCLFQYVRNVEFRYFREVFVGVSTCINPNIYRLQSYSCPEY